MVKTIFIYVREWSFLIQLIIHVYLHNFYFGQRGYAL